MSSDVKPESKLTFDLENGVIASGDSEVRLNRQGIRCFELLTKHPDVVISKDDFIEQCWKKYGYLVTDNSVRQTFFQLRRALEEIGAPPDTLITIPKKGYKLSPDVHFTILNAETESVNDEHIQHDIPDEHDIPAESLSVNVSARRSHLTLIWIFFILVISFSVGFFIRYQFMVTAVSYDKHTTRGTVNYYFQKGYTNDKNETVSRVERWLVNPVLRQKPATNVYVNISQDQNLSLFLCSSEIEGPDSRCVTANILGENN